jgi:hypothetical protein
MSRIREIHAGRPVTSFDFANSSAKARWKCVTIVWKPSSGW